MAMFRTQTIRSPLMRVSFSRDLFKSRKNDDGVDKWGCTLILPKADADGLKKLQSMVVEVVTGQWGDGGIERFKKGLIKNPILDGLSKQAHNKEGQINAGMGDHVVFIRCSSNEPVKVVDEAVLPISDPAGFPSGYWGLAAINCFAWHNKKNGDGVTFGISMIQRVKKDEPLGNAAPNPDGFFEPVADAPSVGGGGAGDLFG